MCEPIIVNLNVKQWNRLLQKAHDFSTDESLSSSEEIALLELIEPDDKEDDGELDYIPPLLASESEEDYDWDSE
jgi:hypothetical protein